MSMFRRAMDYLGLGPDDAYEDYDASAGPARPARDRRPTRRHDQPVYDDEDMEDDIEDDYEPEPRRTTRPPRTDSPARARMGRDDSGVVVRQTTGQAPTVRTLPSSNAEPLLFTPQRYEEVREIADAIKSGRTVKMDIGTTDSTTAHRLIDFVSGLVYAIDGGVDKVAPGVFLVRPHGARARR